MFGLASGAAAGMLTAPQSGRALRRRLRRAGEDWHDRITETGEEWLDRGRELVDDAARKARRTASRVSA
jgi:gas vesicle protein